MDIRNEISGVTEHTLRLLAILIPLQRVSLDGYCYQVDPLNVGDIDLAWCLR